MALFVPQSDDPRYVVYLLGAGACRDIGLPDSAGILKVIQDSLRDYASPDIKTVVDEFVKLLTKQRGAINFEDLLSAFAALSAPDNSELWPFVSELKQPFADILKTQPYFFREMHRRLMGVVRSELTLDEDFATDPRASYLRELVRLIKESSSPTVFTLNYDLSVERAMEAEGFKYSTGFIKPTGVHATYMPANVAVWPLGFLRTEVEMYPHRFDQTEEGEEADIRLVKVHGSLNWFRIPRPPAYEGGLKLVPEDPIVKCDFVPDEVVEETMIMGRSGKVRLTSPFFTLLQEFHYNAIQANVIVSIGYSFSDEHINRVLVNAQLSERSNSFDLIVVNPGWPRGRDYNAAMSHEAKETWRLLCSAGEQSYNLENLSRVKVLPFTAAEAIRGGHLRGALSETIAQRRTRRSD